MMFHINAFLTQSINPVCAYSLSIYSLITTHYRPGYWAWPICQIGQVTATGLVKQCSRLKNMRVHTGPTLNILWAGGLGTK